MSASTNKSQSIKRSQMFNQTLLTLEREKFELLKKLKNYEDRDSLNETEKRRILKRQKKYKENMMAMEKKIKEYRDNRKELQKKIIYLIQYFCKNLDKITVYNHNYLGSMGKMMQSLALGQNFSLSDLKIFTPSEHIDNLFHYIETLNLKKIDFAKVKKSIKKRIHSSKKEQEKIESLNCMYDGLLSKINPTRGDLSKEDFHEIMDRFEAHKQLLIENSGLLSRKSLNDSVDISSICGNSVLENSMNVSAMSSVLDLSNLRSNRMSSGKYKDQINDDRKELMFLCEELGDKTDDVDLQTKLANKRVHKLKKEVERMSTILDSKKSNLEQAEQSSKQLEDEFESILTKLEEIESEGYQCNYYDGLLKSGISYGANDLKVKMDLASNFNNVLSSSYVSLTSSNLKLKENLSP